MNCSLSQMHDMPAQIVASWDNLRFTSVRSYIYIR